MSPGPAVSAPSPTGDGGVAWIRADGFLQVLDLTTGKLRWSTRVAKTALQLQVHGAAVLVSAGVVLFAGRDALSAYDARTGKRRWQQSPLPEQPLVVVADGVAVLTTASSNGKPQRVVGTVPGDRKGAVAKTFCDHLPGGARRHVSGSPAHRGLDPVFREYMLVPRTGTTRWSAPAQLIPSGPGYAEAIAGDHLLQVTFTYDLYRKYTLLDRDLRTGHVRWKVALHGPTAQVVPRLVGSRDPGLPGRPGRWRDHQGCAARVPPQRRPRGSGR